jgi:hypothetical protein
MNAPTQTETEIKARNVQRFGKVLKKRYPELEIEAVDISAHLYATDLRQFPLEVTFDLVRDFDPVPMILPDRCYCGCR